LAKQPASTQRVRLKFPRDEIAEFSERVRRIDPTRR
jgi:hypothetical protein